MHYIIIVVLAITTAAHASTDAVPTTKLLCISDTAGGLIFRNDRWQGTSYKGGQRYIITLSQGRLISVKDFGAPDEVAITLCRALEPSKSFECNSNFDKFRYQPSTRRFVYAQTAGHTTEFEAAGLPSSGFTPNISVGTCEAI